MKENFAKAWKQLPSTIRKTIALVVGFTLIITGLLLVILLGAAFEIEEGDKAQSA
jgi:hypothetical protein